MTQTPLEKGIEIFISVFLQYAGREEPHNMLSRGEFTKLKEEQLPNSLPASRTPEDIGTLFEETDQNKDEQVSFQEFLTFLNHFLMNTYATLHRDH